MKISFINNDGAGFASYVDVEPGTTVEKFFTDPRLQALPPTPWGLDVADREPGLGRRSMALSAPSLLAG